MDFLITWPLDTYEIGGVTYDVKEYEANSRHSLCGAVEPAL